MNSTILVTGGTGTLGRAVTNRLDAAGADTRVLSRLPGPGRIVGDLQTGAGIDDAVRGATAIVHCATGRRGDEQMTGTLIDAARRGDANPHLIYVSIVGVDQIPLGYYQEKLAVERLVERGDLPWTIQRATQFHDQLARLFGALSRSPLLPVPAGIRTQPVDVRDVAVRLVDLAVGQPAGRAPDLGGPQVRKVGEFARTWLAVTHRQRGVLPLWVPGRVAAAYRDGAHLTARHADGRITFEEYLSTTHTRNQA